MSRVCPIWSCFCFNLIFVQMPEEDHSKHSTPIITYSCSPFCHPQSAHTLGLPINLQYSQNPSEGSSSHPIQISPVNSPLSVHPSHVCMSSFSNKHVINQIARLRSGMTMMFKLFQKRKASTSHPILQVMLARKIRQMFLNLNKGRQVSFESTCFLSHWHSFRQWPISSNLELVYVC